MGDHNGVAAWLVRNTLRIQIVPKVSLRGGIYPSESAFGHLVVTENDIVMQVQARTYTRRPLVADKTGEAAVFGSVISRFRRVTNVAPGVGCRGMTALRVIATEAPTSLAGQSLSQSARI